MSTCYRSHSSTDWNWKRDYDSHSTHCNSTHQHLARSCSCFWTFRASFHVPISCSTAKTFWNTQDAYRHKAFPRCVCVDGCANWNPNWTSSDIYCIYTVSLLSVLMSAFSALTCLKISYHNFCIWTTSRHVLIGVSETNPYHGSVYHSLHTCICTVWFPLTSKSALCWVFAVCRSRHFQCLWFSLGWCFFFL